MKMFSLIIFYLLSIIVFPKQIEVGIDEKLGDYLPLNLSFNDSEGNEVQLKDVINKPTILALVYYECPNICSPLLTELAWVSGKIDLLPYQDYKILTVSFDHHETSEIAKKWKNNYFASLSENFPDSAWTFLTGDSIAIKKLTDAVGFYFKPVEKEFLHPGAIITVSPKGKISRYVFGLQYNPFDLKMALIDANSGKTNPTVAKVLEFCYSYDPEGRGYTLNITRIFGTIMLLSLGIFLTVLLVKKRKN